jgi:serine protease
MNMKLSLSLGAFLAVATGQALAVDCPVTAGAKGFEVRAGAEARPLPQLIIKFRSTVLGAAALNESIAAPFELLETVAQVPTPPQVVVYDVNLPLSMNTLENASEIESLADRARERPDVEYAHANYPVEMHAGLPSDPCYALQWHYWGHGSGPMQSAGGIDLPAIWPTNTGSADVVVAVIDTGLVASHPDLNPANVVPGWDFIDNDPDATDVGPANGFHGTHVAGTIGVLATDNGNGAASINWSVRIQPIRALDGNGSGSFLGIANAILWAAGGTVTGVPQNPTPAKVINLSLGGRTPCLPNTAQLMIDAINFAHQQGAIVVVSAGNSQANAVGFTPASCPNTMTVAATNFSGQRAWYSNFGETVEIAAPGGMTTTATGQPFDENGDGHPDGVLSSVAGGYEFYQGTSMAAPHVSGVAALVYAKDPNATSDSVTLALLSSVTPINCDLPCGKGLLNAAAAQ